MELLSALALVLLVLVGYSSGITLGAGRRRRPGPGVADLLLVVALLGAALLIRDRTGRWIAFLLAIPPAIAVGAGAAAVRWRAPGGGPGSDDDTAEGTEVVGRSGGHGSGPPDAVATASDPGSPWRRILDGWKRFALRMGDFQGRLTMALFYFAVVTPFALAVRFFRNPLAREAGDGSTFWSEREPAETELEGARKQG